MYDVLKERIPTTSGTGNTRNWEKDWWRVCSKFIL